MPPPLIEPPAALPLCRFHGPMSFSRADGHVMGGEGVRFVPGTMPARLTLTSPLEAGIGENTYLACVLRKRSRLRSRGIRAPVAVRAAAQDQFGHRVWWGSGST